MYCFVYNTYTSHPNNLVEIACAITLLLEWKWKEMFDVTIYLTHLSYGYMVSDIYMAKDHSDNETANPLWPLCGLLCSLSNIPQIAQNTSQPFCMAGIRNGLVSPPRGMDPMTIHTSSRHSIIEFTACVYILLSLIKYTQLI